VSADHKKKALETIQTFNDFLAKHAAAQQERDKAEAARRAGLSPAQREAEDRIRAEQAARALRSQQLQKLAKLGDAVRKPDTWTIASFCWLLLAEDPKEPEGFTFFDGRSADITKLHQQYRSILESCVHTRLIPVNPGETVAEKYRFPAHELVAAACFKRLGCYETLAEFLGVSSSVPAALDSDAAPVAASVTPTDTKRARRESQTLKRRAQLVEFARTLAKAGKGTDRKTHIALGMLGVELNELFRSAHPEWAATSDKTFERDRAIGKVRIDVRTGRRRITEG
jgi:hypothetical protein